MKREVCGDCAPIALRLMAWSLCFGLAFGGVFGFVLGLRWER